MSTRPSDEILNPAAALDRLPRYRCVLMGLAAGVSSLAAAFAGVIVLYGTLMARPNADLWISPAFGGGLLIVGLFMVLVWWRLWFGPRVWLDRAINRLVVASYIYLLWAMILLMAFALMDMSDK